MPERLRHVRRSADRCRHASIDVIIRKGFTHGMRVGVIEGVEHDAQHRRYRRLETGRVGKAAVSENGVGPHPRNRGLAGGCSVCAVARRP